ncbi:MAG TPA: 4-(cytidine 5'-diphospho)-2-C-methyl-D-erythritol kinase [Thermoanaerobaculia bacterium]|jgi:4-diphosphocytidyl-2-C-methyl-D-erythritol kinase
MDVRAYAKINLGLRVTGKRADGFHDIETIFQTISLHDTLTFTPADALTLTCDAPDIPTDETNLVMRAARAVGGPPMAIALRKRIPAGGGLGGGSADAAATLRALGRPDPELALQLGSDVPFFLLGGTAYATGRGEALTPLPSLAGMPLVLVMPEERVGTAQAYAMLRRFSPPLGLERVRAMIADDFLSHASELVNDFEDVVPHLAAIKTRLYALGAAWAGMSGSGSTIAGAFRDARDRDAALAQLTNAVAAETTAAAPD